MKRVVSDTGPVFHLQQACAVEILGLGCAVSIPPQVDRELGRLLPHWRHDQFPWLSVTELNARFYREANEWTQAGLLDSGESEAIALSQQVAAEWLLTDDAAARLFAQALGLEVHGSLGVILWAAGQKLITPTEARSALEGLWNSTLWVSPRIVAEAHAALEDLIK